MTRKVARIDVSAMPDMARLAREVARDGRPCVLQEDSVDIPDLKRLNPRTGHQHQNR